MIDPSYSHAKTTVADEIAHPSYEDMPLAVPDWSVACVLLLAVLVGGYLFHYYCEFLHQDMKEEGSEGTDAQKKDALAIPISEHRMQAQLSEEKVFSPISVETCSTAFTSIPEDGSFSSAPVSRGTTDRMGALPPTAKPSISPLSSNARPKSWSSSKKSGLASISESAQLTSTDCMTSSSSESSCLFLPPELSPDFAESCKDGMFCWKIPPEHCHAFVLGSPIEVQGEPSLHARLVTAARGEKMLEMGTMKDFSKPDVVIGPLSQCLSSVAVAEIIGPDGQVYGTFLRNADGGLEVTHTAREGNVLCLNPVKTSKGAFLEISAEDHPISLVNLNDPRTAGVEIDSDPDVDAFLIVSCVLASLVAAPELLLGKDNRHSM